MPVFCPSPRPELEFLHPIEKVMPFPLPALRPVTMTYMMTYEKDF